jgi:phenolic acid decarboxylase
MEDQQKATKVTLYLPQDLHRQLKIRSAVDGEPMSALAERALQFYLSHSDVVEEYSDHGNTYRTYHCPSCSDSVVMREGELVSVKDVVESSQCDELHVDVPGVVPEGARPEEGQLVHC